MHAGIAKDARERHRVRVEEQPLVFRAREEKLKSPHSDGEGIQPIPRKKVSE